MRDARWLRRGGALSAPLLITTRPPRAILNMRGCGSRRADVDGRMDAHRFGSAARRVRRPGGAGAAGESRIAVPVRLVADAAGMLAAATGLVMTTYTGVLVGATTIPAWNRSVSVLPIHFAASGLGAAVSLLELLGHDHPALNRLGIAAALAEVAQASCTRSTLKRRTRRSEGRQRRTVVRAGPPACSRAR